ncbi:hypothetical protein [Amycolatopsis sp. Hca4]|uniref:hypothetical protein n=1 Tax=Amycolatopsis sp. Hca4 TaxID=2742131 RepID=UPI0015901AF2|nr:hypothetical protein [Amycolatopsis sp. Hca4]QKV74127.1 hypothetical protein HUT10_10375 [Amycolatopsis sp. Hca4]
MIKLRRRGKITDRELDAILAGFNDKIGTTLERGADTAAGLRALLAADRARSVRPVEQAVDVAAASAGPARPSLLVEGPRMSSSAMAVPGASRTAYVVIGIAGLVVATAFAAVAELSGSPGSDIAGATETVSDARPLTSIASLTGPAMPGTVTIGGRSYPGFTIPTGCTDTVVETTLDPAGYQALLLRFAATGSRPIRYRVDVDHLTRSTGTVTTESTPTALTVPLDHTNVNAAPSTTAAIGLRLGTGNVTISITASADGCAPADLVVGAAVVP